MLQNGTNPLLSVILALSCAGALGCSSGTSGNSGTFGNPTTTGTATATDDSSPTTDPASTSDETFGSSTAEDDGSSSTSTGSTGPTEDGARLEWSIAGDVIDYGPVPVDSAASNLIEIENVGNATATSLATSTIAGDFSFPSGYPGTDGTCGTELEPGASCLLQLRFGPTRVGPVESALVLDYYDGIDLGAPTQTPALTLRGGGEGESANLLQNGNAESGAIDPWDWPNLRAAWEITTSAFGGTYAFRPTGAFLLTHLQQSVDISAWNDETAAPGLQYRVRTRVRSGDPAHQYRVYALFGEEVVLIGGGAESAWTLLEGTQTLPPGVDSAVVSLECSNGAAAGGPCDVTFDDVTFQLVYP